MVIPHKAMVAFEVHLNGKKLCTAGVGELGVLSTCLAWQASQPEGQTSAAVVEHLRLEVGGLAESGEHFRWIDRKVKRGDILTIKVVRAALVDNPRKRDRPNPAARLRSQKEYVRRMAKQLGWKIQM
jgi:hypothetical protein